MPLTQIQINTLQSLFDSMDIDELNEVIDMIFEEAFKRDWDEIKEKQR